jgi:hypothetical protein
MLCSAFSFLRLFTPDATELPQQQYHRALFSADISYRTVSDDIYRHQAPPLTFLVELIGYCLASLSTDVKKVRLPSAFAPLLMLLLLQTAGLDDEARSFVERHSGAFEASQRLLVEQALYMLVAYVQLFAGASMPPAIVQDYADVLGRLRVLVLQQQEKDDGFLKEIVLQPMQALELRLAEQLGCGRVPSASR